MSKNLVDSIAGDLGICSVQTEQKNEYTRRIQYTALRYWMMAYTLDDGFGGAYGVSEKTVIRKAERWLNEMEEMHLPEGKTKPLSQKDYRDICRTMLWNMIAIGDLAKTSDNMVRCVEGHTVMFAPGMNAIVGFNDPTIRRHNSTLISGSIVFKTSDNAQMEPAVSSRSMEPSVVPQFKTIDSFHSRLILDVGPATLPSRCRCWLEMISWPDYGHGGNGRIRIIRRELERQCRWLLSEATSEND